MTVTVADEVVEYILNSGLISGYLGAPYHDVTIAPFKDKGSKIVRSEASSLGADDIESQDNITIYFYTKANPSAADVKAAAADAESVKRLMLQNRGGTGRIFNFEVLSGLVGPLFDSQGRRAWTIQVAASYNSIC